MVTELVAVSLRSHPAMQPRGLRLRATGLRCGVKGNWNGRLVFSTFRQSFPVDGYTMYSVSNWVSWRSQTIAISCLIVHKSLNGVLGNLQ